MISNSTNAGEAYLEYPKEYIKSFLGKKNVRALFIPYAGVTTSFDDYSAKVSQRFKEAGYQIDPIHNHNDPVKAVLEADVIVIGGGNTFQLIRMIQENGLIEPIRKKVLTGTPYVGWSAGANVACPTICTTNDMPIIQPLSFAALNLVPFQINPHYLDANPEGHAGETREARIEEFIEVNRDVFVAGLREGTMFRIENGKIDLIGMKSARIFRYGSAPQEINPGTDISFILKQ